MPYSKRKISCMKASQQRSLLHNSSGSRRIDVVLPAINPINKPPEVDKRISQVPSIYHPPSFKQRRWRKKTKEEKRQFTLSEQRKKLIALEKKWYAIFCFAQHQKEDGSIPTRIGNLIASRHGYTLKQLKNLVKSVMKGGSLLRLPGSGRKRTKFDVGNRCLHEIFQEYGGELSQLALTSLANQKGLKVDLWISYIIFIFLI